MWTVRLDEDEVTLGVVSDSERAERDVRGYEREVRGRIERVNPYHRMWWMPHPEGAEKPWVIAAERSWVARGEAAWEARGEAAERAEHGARETAEEGGRMGAKALGTPGREAHGYESPDPERLVRPKARAYKSPTDHPFFQKNPVSADNIVKAYYDSTPSERYQGLRWYADAHRLAWALGGGDVTKGAAILSAFSPQTAWPVNMFNAARSLAEGRALGPGEGMITANMQKAAQKVLDGAGIDEALPSSKTNAFARLIALGEDHPDDKLGQVVVDRHAMSVAAGRRLLKADVDGKGENASPIGQVPMYEHVADQYREAARQISEREGEEIAPHQLQAVTWLRQQRINTAMDEKGTSAARGKGLITGIRNAWGKWQDYAQEHGLRTELGTTALPPTPITEAEARGNSRAVSASEFYDLAGRGRDMLNSMAASRSPTTGLAGNWDSLASQAYQAAQQSWGGVTIDAHTGEVLESDADKYALSVKPPGLETVSVPEDATEAEFDKAMDQALQRFGSLLERANYHLGVFHDDDNHRIDIDPVVVVNTPAEAEAIGSYSHNIGGAYHFKSGDGYFPPHIQGETGVTTAPSS